jgi:hypothetical protein
MCLERWQFKKETSPFLALFFLKGNIKQNIILLNFSPPNGGNSPP